MAAIFSNVKLPLLFAIIILFISTEFCTTFTAPPLLSISPYPQQLGRRTLTQQLFSGSKENDDNAESTSTVLSQAALIAGTTIGGGFLALPTATAPCGALPSTIGLIGVWFFLLGGALSLSNSIFLQKEQHNIDGYKKKTEDISLFSLIRDCFGNISGLVGGLLFLLLIKVTLVAQLSKIGVLLEASIPMIGRQTWTVYFSTIITVLCLFLKQRSIEKLNDILTATMLSSFATLVALAMPSGWSFDGLRRSDFSSLLPSSSWAIPVFVQLLIYNEVVPLVASRLDNEDKVRRAILLGSSIPLIMCLVWSYVSLGLVPYDPTIASSTIIYDPLSKLGGIVNGSFGKAFLCSVNVLAGSAICTTVIGSILASIQYFDDVIANLRRRRGEKDKIDDDSTIRSQGQRISRRMCTHALAIIPSLYVAISGSTDLYYKATSFAGEYPCTLLYGLLPPLCNLRLRWKYYRKVGRSRGNWKDIIPQLMLAGVSVAILILNNISS